jgi:mRNA interferase MazF
MTTYSPATIVYVDFPNTDGAAGKPRPALVILDTGDADVLLARITSQSRPSQYELPIVDWAAAGLRMPSSVRVHKLATMQKQKTRYTVGTLSSSDRQTVSAALSSMFSKW